MCCGSESHHGGGHRNRHGCSCTCGCHADIGPCFWSKKEKIAWLEEHLQGLETEVQSIQERISALKEED